MLISSSSSSSTTTTTTSLHQLLPLELLDTLLGILEHVDAQGESHVVVQLDGLEGLEVQVEPLQMKDHRKWPMRSNSWSENSAASF
jgi:hypothetical protein